MEDGGRALRHIRDNHGNTMNNRCSCGRQFGNVQNFLDHICTVHLLYLFVCVDCGFITESRAPMEGHVSEH